jgi:hypothetical protein
MSEFEKTGFGVSRNCLTIIRTFGFVIMNILMFTTRLNAAFELTETIDFWVAQPATSAEGKTAIGDAIRSK